MSSLYLGFTFLLLAYLVYWLLQNDDAESIGDQKGLLSMRDMKGEESQRRTRTREADPVNRYSGGKEAEKPRFGPHRIREHDYLADRKLKERPRSPQKVPARKY